MIFRFITHIGKGKKHQNAILIAWKVAQFLDEKIFLSSLNVCLPFVHHLDLVVVVFCDTFQVWVHMFLDVYGIRLNLGPKSNQKN